MLELMMWELAEHELLRLVIFQRVVSVKNCGTAAIFGHCQNAYTCYTDTLAILKESQKLGISAFF